MAANAKSDRRSFGVWFLVIVACAIVLVLLAPGAVGRLVGDLWITTMGAVMGLLGGVLG
jgi:hypothetical protein